MSTKNKTQSQKLIQREYPYFTQTKVMRWVEWCWFWMEVEIFRKSQIFKGTLLIKANNEWYVDVGADFDFQSILFILLKSVWNFFWGYLGVLRTLHFLRVPLWPLQRRKLKSASRFQNQLQQIHFEKKVLFGKVWKWHFLGIGHYKFHFKGFILTHRWKNLPWYTQNFVGVENIKTK